VFQLVSSTLVLKGSYICFIELRITEHMKVQMKDRLSCTGAIVDH
jgi:hypothetical protein